MKAGTYTGTNIMRTIARTHTDTRVPNMSMRTHLAKVFRTGVLAEASAAASPVTKLHEPTVFQVRDMQHHGSLP